MDNWTFQNAAELLNGGLSAEDDKEILFSDGGNTFHYGVVPSAIIQLECVFQVLHHVVLAETCVVDNQNVGAWSSQSHLASLRAHRIVAVKPFEETRNEWLPIREQFERELCFCPELERLHRENVNNFDPKLMRVPDPYLSQLLWGGAGMLARAWYARVPYVPHPLRDRLFRGANLLPRAPRAQSEFSRFLDSERLKIFERADSQGYFGRLNLPPIALEVIANSNKIEDLVPVAIQLRDSYAKLRQWLSELQQAFDAEDIAEVIRRKRTLEDVARGIESVIGTSSAGNTSVEFGVGAFKIKTGIGPLINRLRNRLGMRAQISRLILGSKGTTGVHRLLEMLGEGNTARGISLERSLLARNEN